MESETKVGAAGRTVVTLRDNRGEPQKFVSQGVDCKGYSRFVEIISIPLAKDPFASPPRPSPMVRGQIFITCQAAPAEPIAIEYVLADVKVVGYVGSLATVIGRQQLGGLKQSMRVTFQEDDTFDRVAIEVRQILNGEPSDVVLNSVDALNVSALAIMWS